MILFGSLHLLSPILVGRKVKQARDHIEYFLSQQDMSAIRDEEISELESGLTNFFPDKEVTSWIPLPKDTSGKGSGAIRSDSFHLARQRVAQNILYTQIGGTSSQDNQMNNSALLHETSTDFAGLETDLIPIAHRYPTMKGYAGGNHSIYGSQNKDLKSPKQAKARGHTKPKKNPGLLERLNPFKKHADVEEDHGSYQS